MYLISHFDISIEFNKANRSIFICFGKVRFGQKPEQDTSGHPKSSLLDFLRSLRFVPSSNLSLLYWPFLCFTSLFTFSSLSSHSHFSHTHISPIYTVSPSYPIYISCSLSLSIFPSHSFPSLNTIMGSDILKPHDPPCSSNELHVLAVDDSYVDRKVIEKLLKVSSFKGDILDFFCHYLFSSWGHWVSSEVCNFGNIFSDCCREWH